MTESRFAFLERYPHFPAALAKKAREAEADYPERYGASLAACRTAAEKITEFLLAQTGLPAKGSIANPFFSRDNPRSKPELDLARQTDRLFVLLKEDLISYQDKSERFDFIRAKGNAAAHEDSDNPYTEADAAAALEHLLVLCRQLAERYPTPQPPRAPRCFRAPDARSAAPAARRGAGIRIGNVATILAILIGAAIIIPLLIYAFFALRDGRQPETPSDAFQAASAPAANILRYADGSVYQGETVNGKAEAAHGKITYADGSVCEGRFANDRLNGDALCRYADGSSYQGSFIDGIRSGQGRIVYADGGSYSGGFANGEPAGIGELSSGTNSYTGRVSGRSPAGEGVLAVSNGERCTGSFTAAAADCRFADGSRYQGGFDAQSLNFHGQGSLSDAAGKLRFKGEWRQGQPVQSALSEFERIRSQAEAGDAEAQNELGHLYWQGKDVPKDDKMAALWYHKAASQGYAAAQYNLGVLYEQGRGVSQDSEQALLWYRRAAERGNERAAERLAALERQNDTPPADAPRRKPEGDTIDELF